MEKAIKNFNSTIICEPKVAIYIQWQSNNKWLKIKAWFLNLLFNPFIKFKVEK